MPTFIDTVLDVLTHPSVMPMIHRMLTSGNKADGETDVYTRLEQKIDEMRETMSRKRRGRPKSAESRETLDDVANKLVLLSGTLDEALRFVREDGLQHPEAKMRLEDAEKLAQELLDAERYALSPAKTVSWPEADRKTAEAVLPYLRRARQALLNRLTSPEGVAEAAAAAHTAVTALQAARMGKQMMEAPTKPKDAYSNYAPEMSLDAGCIPCGLGHLGMVAATLSKAAQGDEPAERVVAAQKELSALLQYDWTPERIGKNPQAEQRILKAYLPQVEALKTALANVHGEEDVKIVAEAAQDLWTRFQQDVKSLPSGAFHREADHVPQYAPSIREMDGLIEVEYRDFGYVSPSRQELKEIADRIDYATLMDRVKRLLQSRGTQVLTMSQNILGPGVEAEYLPRTKTILLNPSVESPNNFQLQTLVHEAAHGLLHSPECLPQSLDVGVNPEVRRLGEAEADLVTIGVLSELGLPIIYADGSQESPGDYVLDWKALREKMGDRVAERVRWAVDTIVAAAQEAPTPQPFCPPPPPLTVIRGLGTPYGYGLSRQQGGAVIEERTTVPQQQAFLEEG